MGESNPHSIDAERAVLGAILLRNELMAQAVIELQDAHFYRTAHSILFRACITLHERNEPLDLVTLSDYLRRQGQLDIVGGPAYIAGLVDGVPRSSNVATYAAIVRDYAHLRSCVRAGERLAAEAKDSGDRPIHIIERTVSALEGIVPASHDQATADDLIQQFINDVVGGTIAPPIPTGFTDLDQLVDGFIPGDLVIIAARPSTGKTALALGIGQHMAWQNVAVAFFSLEMSARAVAKRLIQHRARVSARQIEREDLNPHEMDRVSAAVAHDPSPFYIETGISTVMEIAANVQQMKHGGVPLQVAIVDYLQMLSPERRRDSDEAEVAGISRGLKRLATNENIVVVALSQLSRAPEARRDKRPQMSDLRGSGALEQDADMGLLLFRQDMYERTEESLGVAEVIVAKNRNGPTGVVRLAFIDSLALFDNLEWRV